MSNANCSVIIRSQNCQDQNILFEKDWTVNRLKQEIQNTFPGKPKVEKQRLIHGGKELQDDQQLNSIVKNSSTFIMLVCIGIQESSQEIIPPNVPTTTLPQSSSSNPIPTSAYLRHPCHRANQMNPLPTQMYANLPGANLEMYNQWCLQYQNYMANYMQQYYQSAAYSTTTATSVPNIPNEPTAVEVNDEQQIEPNVQQNAGRANPPQPAGPGGAFMQADEEDGEGGDWLDAAFGLTRLGFLLSIIYYYSTTYRFVITLLVFLGIYLYQIGLFNINRRQAAPPEVQENLQNIDDNNNRSSDEEDSITDHPNLPPPPGLLSTAWCFVRTFVTSLVPQHPAAA